MEVCCKYSHLLTQVSYRYVSCEQICEILVINIGFNLSEKDMLYSIEIDEITVRDGK